MAKREKSEKGILFYEEGYAEAILYKRVIEWISSHSTVKYKIRHKNLKGEGNTHQIPGYYRTKILPEKISYTVFFCYDTDVMERAIGRKPAIRWNEAKKQLKELGVKKVYEIRQNHSIEDILIKDVHGILKHLGLPANTKINGNRGDDILKKLYGQAGKVYVHSSQTMMQRLIDELDVERIVTQSKDILQPLLQMYGL